MTNHEDPTNPEPTQSTFGTAEHKKDKRPKLLLALVLLALTAAVVIGALWFIINRFTVGDQEAVMQNAVETIDPLVARVEIGADGIVPQTIRVKAGQQVTFTNQDAIPHRLVANEELLQDFDSLDKLTTGDTYTYVFDTPGTYSYYDPEDGVNFSGVVEVQ